ncbi:MAG: hypothetical protein Q4C50_01830 [Eubacteriales bacterium]|nr:hypothetical protein [Eubacteriales bacterium]
MKWYRKLYLGSGITRSRKEMIEKIEKNAGTPNVYLITLAANGRDLFDIFSSDYLLQPVLHGHCPLIVGLAKGREEAEQLALDIAMEAYYQNGNFDVRAYLEENIKDGGGLAFEFPMEQLKKRKRFLFRKQDSR